GGRVGTAGGSGGHGSLVPHELDPERALGLVEVVRPAPKADAGYSRGAASGDFLHVIELDPVARFVATAVLAYERAAALVSLPHGALDVGRDVTGSGRPRRCRRREPDG